MSEEKKPELATQEKALTQYLDSLLMEIPDEYPAEAQQTEVVERQATDLESSPIEVVEEVLNETFQAIPTWGSAPFKVLYFNVGELTVAAPLDRLGTVLSEYGEIRSMAGAAGYYLGVVVNRGETIRVIDFSRFVASATGELASLEQDGSDRPDRIVVIEGSGIGIACRDLTEVEEVSPDEVRWRSGISHRPWYRGIMKEKMCALLDIGTLVSKLNENESE